MARRSLAGMLSWMLRQGGADAIDARLADVLPILPQIKIPILFVTGLRDDIAPTENAHEMVAAVRSRGTQLVELAARHSPHHDAPGLYERAVLDFLARIVRGGEMMDQVERWLLTEALRDHGGNKTETAVTLGITREGLHKKLAKFGI